MTKARGFFVLLVISLIAVTGAVGAQIYWSRTIQHNITVIGIEAELLIPTRDGYLAKVVATSLTDGKVALTVYSENFEQIWLNLTWTSDAEDLVVTASGQYWKCWEDAGGLWHFDPDGDSFNVLGYHVVNKTKLMWSPSTNTDPPGGLLMVTFSFDTEAVTVPGSYTVDLLFQMGFV